MAKKNAATMDSTTSRTLATAIREGTFPDSDIILTSDLSSSAIPTLINSIRAAQSELKTSVRDISKTQADDVDSWVAQAKKVQDDIARCKQDAAEIVQEHERILALRSTRNDIRSKVGLLREEISFNETLEEQIRLISETSRSLSVLEHDIGQQHFVHAARAVPKLRATISTIASGESRSLLSQVHSGLSRELQKRLEAELHARCRVRRTDTAIMITFIETDNATRAVQGGTDPGKSMQFISLDDALNSLETLDALDSARSQIAKEAENILLPHLHARSKLKILKGDVQEHELRLELSYDSPAPLQLLQALTDLFRYIGENSPSKLKQHLLAHLADQIIPLLIVNWLDPAIPVELERLHELDDLQDQTSRLIATLEQSSPKELNSLELWNNQLQEMWIARRRTVSLDAVRNAFAKNTAATRSVERVERLTAATKQGQLKPDAADDDWAQDWNDNEDRVSNDNVMSDVVSGEESDAWGFDADDQANEAKEPAQDKKSAEVEDEGEAWGWADEEDPPKSAIELEKKIAVREANGLKDQQLQHSEQDTILTEHYTITDIPDSILDQISKDISDLQILQSSPEAYFKDSNRVPTGLQSFPTLVLAMFRAISQNHYQTLGLSNMNLYNDSLYLIDRLDTLTTANVGITIDTQSVQKFARSVYTAELSIQRTIVHDLLDSAQGFVSCTKPPYAAVCDNAISSVTDHLRSMYTQWQPILSPSHLHQAIGNLLNGVMNKIIQDIQDMDDISELESQKLVSFCERVSALQDLFVPQGGTTSQIAFHVASYFRFGYLQEILGGTLLHIKELWEEGGLSTEFDKEEVVDLIKALFAESNHRRNAIYAIRG